MIRPNEAVKGKADIATGIMNYSSSDGTNTTGFVPVNSTSLTIVDVRDGRYLGPGVRCYDSEKNYIGNVATDALKKQTVTIDSEAAFVRLVAKFKDGDFIKINGAGYIIDVVGA